MAADTPADLKKMIDEDDLPFKFLSDPHLVSGPILDIPMGTKKAYYGALALHPEIRHYKQASFLQPALYVWKGKKLVYEWRQSESLLNLFGARGRPTGSDVLDIVKRSLG